MSTRKKKVKTLEELKKETANPKIKVRLDSRTVITIRDLASLDFWKQRYPNLTVLTK